MLLRGQRSTVSGNAGHQIWAKSHHYLSQCKQGFPSCCCVQGLSESAEANLIGSSSDRVSGAGYLMWSS